MKPSYYNEWDKYPAEWIRNLIKAGLIPAGDVDERSITDISPDDLKGYGQCHFFSGIAGWPLALALAGWPEDREVWTGSCPCQPFSLAGKGKGQKDERHLWPVMHRLIQARNPATFFGEQVAAAIGKDWLDGVFADLEADGYECGAAVVPACAVNAPHRRDRLWFVAESQGKRGDGPLLQSEREGLPVFMDASGGHRIGGSLAMADTAGREGRGSQFTGIPADAGPGGPMEYSGGRRHGLADEALCTGRDAPIADGFAGGTLADTDSHGCQKGRSAAEALGQGSAAHTGRWSCRGVADPNGPRLSVLSSRAGNPCAQREASIGDGGCGDVGYAQGERWGEGRAEPELRGRGTAPAGSSPWDGAAWLQGADGKTRRVKPGVCLLVDGVSGSVAVRCPAEGGEEAHYYSRVGALKALGNAIVPQVAAEFIAAFLECRP